MLLIKRLYISLYGSNEAIPIKKPNYESIKRNNKRINKRIVKHS